MIEWQYSGSTLVNISLIRELHRRLDSSSQTTCSTILVSTVGASCILQHMLASQPSGHWFPAWGSLFVAKLTKHMVLDYYGHVNQFPHRLKAKTWIWAKISIGRIKYRLKRHHGQYFWDGDYRQVMINKYIDSMIRHRIPVMAVSKLTPGRGSIYPLSFLVHQQSYYNALGNLIFDVVLERCGKMAYLVTGLAGSLSGLPSHQQTFSSP